VFNNPFFALFLILLQCLVWMRLINLLASKNHISSSVSSTLLPIGTSPLFLICWMLFAAYNAAGYIAAVLPLLIMIHFFLVGRGFLKEYPSVQSMARTEQKSKLIKSPLFYGIVNFFIALVIWKEVDAVMASMIHCGGDVAADPAGSRDKTPVLTRAKKKAIVRFRCVFFSGALLTILKTLSLIHRVTTRLTELRIGTVVFARSPVITMDESITPSDYDNLPGPATSLLLSTQLL